MAKEADSYVIRDYLKSNPISESNTYAKVALKFNAHKERIRSIWRRLESYNVKNVSEKTSHEVKDYKNGTSEISIVTEKPIKTLKELVKVCEIDESVWNIDKYICNTWGSSWQVKAFMSLKKPGSIDHLQVFKDFVNSRNLKILSQPTPTFTKTINFEKSKGDTLIINIADLHIGKLVCEEEVGEDYNVKIACERFKNALEGIINRACCGHMFKTIILSTLGDTLHVDTTKSTTTSGTYVESDTRASKIFTAALQVITEGIEYCTQFADNVEFININGNHCELSEQHLGIAIGAFFRRNNNVKIDSEPLVRKYRLIGKNMIAWAHGDTIVNTLPLTMATEKAEMWGQSLYRLMQLGHLHGSKKKVFQSEDEFNGVIVRHFSSLTSTDSWHNKNNYVNNNKKATGIVFNENEVGPVAEYNFTIK